MKNNTFIISLIAILIAIAVISFNFTRSYYKKAERELVANYNAEIKANTDKIAEYETLVKEYKARMKADSLVIVDKSKEAAKLQAQNAKIKGDLVIAQSKIKNFTAGEAIQYFVEYSGTTDSKMLVQDTDTALVVTQPSVLKVDSIFNEHKYQKLEISNLNQTLKAKDIIIVAQSGYMTDCAKTISAREAQMNVMAQNAATNVKIMQLKQDKLKAQRNRARWTIGGIAAAAVGITVLNFATQ